jgi:hypothetical protein
MSGAAIRAGMAYFAIIFAVAFGLGTLRVVAIAPALGERGAVLLEVAVLLSIAWPVAAVLIRRAGLGRAVGPRLAMGAVALVLLALAEVALAWALFGRAPSEIWISWQTGAGAIGLAGQVAFGLIPVLLLLRPAA